MSEATLAGTLYAVLYATAIFVVPPLLIATIIAFVVGLFQAVTQIQEQTLPQTVKMLAVGLLMLMFGGALAGPLYATADTIFSNFASYASN